MIENLGRNSKKILKPLNTIEGIVFEFLEPPEGRPGCEEWTTLPGNELLCQLFWGGLKGQSISK